MCVCVCVYVCVHIYTHTYTCSKNLMNYIFCIPIYMI